MVKDSKNEQLTTGALVDMGIKDKLIERAKKELARRTGISDDQIVLKQVEVVTWPDTSLGCPLPGRMYAQVVTPGYRLVLSDGARDYEYHTDNCRRIAFYEGVSGLK